MTAGDRREELEAKLWQLGLAPEAVTEVMACARAWVKAAVKDSRDPKAPASATTAAVHYEDGGPACLGPHERDRSGWATTTAAVDVTCGHCRKRPAWLEAAGGAP